MDDYFKLASIISPFISAFLAAILTYYFTLRSKKFDILYQNKVPAYKEMSAKLTDFKRFCMGRVAYLQGNEFSSYYEEGVGSLHHRTEIAQSVDANLNFFSNNTKAALNNLIAQISILNNFELALVAGHDMRGIEKEYERMHGLTESCIVRLYDDLNL